jgi:uncharacterized membrane protein
VTNEPKQRGADLDLERVVGQVLTTGAVASTILLALGLAGFLLWPGPAADWLVRAGLIVLMATPVMRVVVSVLQYALERDWLFVLATSTVLVLLLGSLAAGRR